MTTKGASRRTATATATTVPTAGDRVEVSGRRVGDGVRSGEILEVLGPPGQPHYRVRWEDGHESILYPHEGASIRHVKG